MSMDVGGAKGGLKADINVTPLVDVMLVLLIIVMLIAPMLQKGIDVNLPEAENTGDKPDTADQTVVHIDRETGEHHVYLERTVVQEVTDAKVEIVWDPPWTRERMSDMARLELGML